jgi:CheY-like chemotaxis protein
VNAPTGPGACRTSRRVLVVDADLDASRALARRLAVWGYEPVVAYDGPAALAVAAADPRPAAALLDVTLPGMEVFELARRLRGQPGLGRFLLVALARRGAEEVVRRCYAEGFDGHLFKGSGPEAVTLVREALEGVVAGLGRRPTVVGTLAAGRAKDALAVGRRYG